MTEPYIRTYTGINFHFLDPSPEEINLIDIVHSLSLQCRFNGHTSDFYSVAQHSVLVSNLVNDPELALTGLLHDATEAYIGDMVTPLKEVLPSFQAIEDRVWVALADHFSLQAQDLPQIKLADREALLLEARDLMGGNVTVTRNLQVCPKPPKEAEEEFLARFYQLSRTG